jgi:hypothetical protein
VNAIQKIAIAALTIVSLLLGSARLATAQVQVTSADPASAVQGTTSLDVTINGSGFDSTAAVKFLVAGTAETGGITVKKVTVRSSKRMIATIVVADTAVVDKFDIEVTLSGGRKGKGTTLFTVLRKTNDPCDVIGLEFPAFTYRQANATGVSIYVADASGKCSRLLFSASPGVQMPRFSFPVDGTSNRGRVVWRDNTQILGGDFTVSGTTVSVEPPYTILPSAGCCALDLSPKGDFLYVSTIDNPEVYDPLTNSRTIKKISIASPQSQAFIKTIIGYDDGWFVSATVNGDESALYVEERRASGTQILGRELIRIDLGTLLSTVLVPNGINPMYAAADSESNLIVYTDTVAGSGGCRALQVANGTTGATISYGQPRYGTHSSWYGGNVLTNGYKPAKGGGLRCDATGMVTEVDAATSAETPLVRGVDPDGR